MAINPNLEGGYVWTVGQWIVPVLSTIVAIAIAVAAPARLRSRRAWVAARPR